MHTALSRTAGSSETQSAALNAVMQQGSARVGQNAASLATLSDNDLNAFILDCAERMYAAQRRYEAHGFMADAGERDHYYHQEAAALRERGCRPHIVAAMEQERGLCGR